MNNFANININKVFDVLGIQLSGRRSVTEVLEYSNPVSPVITADQIFNHSFSGYESENSAVFSGKKREYTGKYYASTFKQAAVKLYLTLYFFSNAQGTTEEISYKEMAELLQVNVKTVKASLAALEEKNYIEVYTPSSKTFFVEISDYNKMYEKGQRPAIGYITLNKKILEKLISLKGINSLRCAVTVVFRALKNQFRSSSKIAATEISIQNITWNLPKYIKPGIIRQAFEQTGTLFDIKNGRFGKYIFILSKEYRASSIKSQIREDAKIKLKELIDRADRIREHSIDDIRRYGALTADTLNDVIGTGISEEEIITAYDRSIPSLGLNAAQRNDITQICTEYNPSVVMSAVWNYFKNYCLKRIHIDNPGGLIREIVKELIQFGPSEEAAMA